MFSKLTSDLRILPTPKTRRRSCSASRIVLNQEQPAQFSLARVVKKTTHRINPHNSENTSKKINDRINDSSQYSYTHGNSFTSTSLNEDCTTDIRVRSAAEKLFVVNDSVRSQLQDNFGLWTLKWQQHAGKIAKEAGISRNAAMGYSLKVRSAILGDCHSSCCSTGEDLL